MRPYIIIMADGHPSASVMRPSNRPLVWDLPCCWTWKFKASGVPSVSSWHTELLTGGP